MRTKSIRLDEDEAKLLETLAKVEHISEASLMKRFIAEGLKNYRLKKAIEMYVNKEADLTAAARIAGVSVRRLMTELEKREIPIYTSPEMFRAGLKALAEAFGERTLRQRRCS